MGPIVITPKSEQEYSLIMELLKKMRIKTTSLHEKPLRRMTMDEYNEMIDQSLAAADAGRTITQAELEKQVQSW